VECLESEQCPLDFDRPTERIRQGIKKDQWRRNSVYYFYPEHPYDYLGYHHADLIPVAAYNVLHPKVIKRLNQRRGVSAFHAILDAITDIWEIDSAERQAAKQGASIGLAIERKEYWDGGKTDAAGQVNERPAITKFYPGMTLDDLDVGEEAKMLSPNGRPNPMLVAFRDEGLRGIAAGLGVGFSRLSRKYSGTYSSERQGLVDHWRLTEPRQQDSQDALVDPMYKRWLSVSFVYNMLDIPWNEVDLSTLFNANHHNPTMPWIDPLKEVTSMVALLDSTIESKSYLQRMRGRNPEDVRNEQRRERELDAAAGIVAKAASGGFEEDKDAEGEDDEAK
jgi:lambda family phage portal protein